MSTQSTYLHQTPQPSPQDYAHDLSPSDGQFSLSAYTRTMHQHTKKQMEAASRSARRRTANTDGTNAHGRLDNEGSVGSMDSARTS